MSATEKLFMVTQCAAELNTLGQKMLALDRKIIEAERRYAAAKRDLEAVQMEGITVVHEAMAAAQLAIRNLAETLEGIVAQEARPS